ncbi:hypothetical protein C8F01DRAFT_1105429 [Mycena amicta]|nr:hypothetical protein C8F01DRAFT_1105429 [Mycena amicta]
MPFDGVKFHLSPTLPGETREHLANLLIGHHAERADSIDDATHIISDSQTFEGWRDVINVFIVTALWVEHSVAAGKIQGPEFYSTDPTKVFSGVVACATDLRPGDEEVINAGILTLGGQWRMGLTKDVTHLFAGSALSEKYATAMQHRKDSNSRIKIVLPDWFDRAILFCAAVDTTPFEWPNPSVFDRNVSTPQKLKQAQQSSMSPKKKALYDSVALEDAPAASDSELDGHFNAWDGRRILLSTTLDLSASRKSLVEKNIRKAGGVVVRSRANVEELDLIDSCDVFVTRHRSGSLFFKAWRKKKTIGTLSWLLHVHIMKNFTSPMDQLLHFPYPDHPVKDFEVHKISVTNYAGDMRDYLKKLITLMGGEFTPSFNGKSNTALVAAQLSGAKTDRAAAFDVPVVNHTWLEDCFLEWKTRQLANPKYVTYPNGVEFSSILGERGFGPRMAEIIAEEAEEAGEDMEERATTPVALSQNRMEETEVDQLMTAPSFGGDDDVFSTPKSARRSPFKSRKATQFDSDVEMDFLPRAGPSTPSKSQSQSPRVLRSAKNSPMNGSMTSPHSSQTRPERFIIPLSTPKSQSMLQRKATPAASKRVKDDSDVEMDDVEVSLSPRRPLTPAAKRKAILYSDSEDDDESDAVRGKKRIVVKRVAPLPSPVKSTPALKNGKGKGKAKAKDPVTDSEPEWPVPPHRRTLVSRTSPHKLPELPSHDSDSDLDLPEVPTLSGVHFSSANKAAAAKASSSSKQKSTSPRKSKPVTPPPPSSSLVASPKIVTRISTKEVSVLVPTLASLSAKKPPAARRGSISVVNNHRRASSSQAATSISAPPRSRTETSVSMRTSSPGASSTVAGEDGAPLATQNGQRSKRAAAAWATEHLHKVVMPDVAKFQTEMRNVRNKRRVSGRSEASTDYVDDESEGPSQKRRRKSRGSSPSADDFERPAKKAEKPVKLLTTKVDLSDGVLKALAKLGARVTNKPTECTHLITTGVVRTEKFLCALASSPVIVTEAWAVESAAAKELLPVDDYLIQDEAGEERYKFNLEEALVRAKLLKGTLFKQHTFYMTPKSFHNLDLIRNVILANGGQFVQVRQPTPRVLQHDPAHRHLVSSDGEEALWTPLTGISVYRSEFVLAAAMQQQLDWDNIDADYIIQ